MSESFEVEESSAYGINFINIAPRNGKSKTTPSELGIDCRSQATRIIVLHEKLPVCRFARIHLDEGVVQLVPVRSL